MDCCENHDGLTLLAARRTNPLRVDPTRTSGIQRRFIADLRARFLELRRQVMTHVFTDDALSIAEDRHSPSFVFHAGPLDFQFNTDVGKLDAFNEWFASQVAAGIFAVPPGTPAGTPWVAEYVESAYKQGLLNAYFAARIADDVHPSGSLPPSEEAFLRAVFLTPEAVSKVRLLATRVFEELRGVTAAMSTQMSRILSQGLIDGKSPLVIAREMTRAIRDLTFRRAFLIARTEIIRAHAEGQLDSFERLGMKRLSIRAEWLTAGDDRVCPICAANEGKIFTVDQARGKIPVHPNCRCTFIPYIRG